MGQLQKPDPEHEHVAGQRRTITMVRWLLYMAFIIIGYLILNRLAPVFTPLLVSAGIAYLLDPLVDRLVTRGVQRVWAVTVLLVAFLGMVATAVILLIPLVVKDLTLFIKDLPGMIENAAAWIGTNVGYEVPVSWQEYLKSPEVSSMLREVAGPATTLAAAAVGGFFAFLGFLAELLIIPVFAFYFLLDWDEIVARGRTMIPPRHRPNVTSIAIEIDSVVSEWIRGQLTVVTILAVLYALAFFILGVPLAISVGVLVGLLTIIPFLGTIAGAIITVILILLDWHGPGQLAAVGGVFVVLHLLEAAVLTPKIVGKKVGLSETAALFAVLAGGKLLGFAGVLLAVPLAASIGVLVRRIVRYYEKSEFFGTEDHADKSPLAAALGTMSSAPDGAVAASPGINVPTGVDVARLGAAPAAQIANDSEEI